MRHSVVTRLLLLHSASPRTDFIPARREYKYLLERRDLPRIRSLVSGYCEPDRNHGPNGYYTLRSLYFDAQDMRLFHANEREEPIRFKARVRTYPDVPGSPIFAEIKLRNMDIIQKLRSRLPGPDWAKSLRASSGTPLDGFTARMHRYGLRPVVLVEYRREAWNSRYDDYARVSIDRGIRCQPTADLTLEADPRRWIPIDHPFFTWSERSVCVLELKWADTPPTWMVRLIQHMDLLRHAFSKYGYSMLTLAEDHRRDARESQPRWA